MLQFLNPLLLLGGLAFAVPLIIHLLNRQRFKKRAWAAMEFLLAAYKKQRRRLRTENLILLLLRCLLPVLLALAIARPVLREAGALTDFGTTAHHILVLDTSYSMALEEGGRTPFDHSRTLAGELLNRIENEQGHKVSLVLAGQFPRRPFTAITNIARAKAALLAEARPEDGSGDLTAALGTVREMVQEPDEADRIVYVFTDLQRRSVGQEALADLTGTADRPDRPVGRETLRDTIESIEGAGAELVTIDAGPEGVAGGRRPNLQITDLRLRQPSAVVRVPVVVVATVRNLDERTRTARVTFEIDGAEPSRQVVEVEPGAERDVEFRVVMRETGRHRLRVGLEDGILRPDNARHLVVEVRERLRVLMVEGRPEVEEGLRETTVMRDFLDPTGGEGAPEDTAFAPEVVEPLALLSGQKDPTRYDLVVLANVPHLNRRAADQLVAALRAGVGVWILLGDRVDPAEYNVVLHRSGSGPLPVGLSAPTGVEPGSPNPYRPVVEEPGHPVFTDIAEGVYLEVFQHTPVYRAMGVDEETLHEDARVLARISNPGQTPLLIARDYEGGHLLLQTSTISDRPDRWNRLDEPIVALMFLHPTAYWLTLPALDAFNVGVGSVLTTSLDHRPTQVTIELPEREGGRSKAPVGEESRPLPGGRFTLPPWTRTTDAGFYTFEMLLEKENGQEPMTLPFAVNVDPAEGELEYLRYDQMHDLGFRRVQSSLPGEGTHAAEGGSSDLSPLFLYALLAFLIGEGAWARFVSRRRA